MSKLIVALFAGAFAFGSVSARADDVDRNPSEGKAAEKGAPAPKKDWPTRREKQEATAAAARERGTGAKEQPLTGDLGSPGVQAPDRSKAAPKPAPKQKVKKPVPSDTPPEQKPAPSGQQ